MNRLNTSLLVLLAIQLLLTIFMFSGNSDNTVFQSGGKFIATEFDKIDQISITDADKKVLTIKQQDQQWQLPDYFDVATDNTKLKRVIDSLSTIKTGWPVARSDAAAPRFKVAPDKFEKRIEFKQQGKLIETLYLGSAPSFRKVHVRKSGDNAIYNIEFSTYELSTENKDWMRKDLLKQDMANLTRVKVNDLVLTKKGEQWQLDGLSTDQQTAFDAATTLINKIGNVTYTEIISAQNAAESSLKTPPLKIQLSKTSGEVTLLTFIQNDGEDYFIGHSSAHDYYFKVSPLSVKPILAINRDQLIAVPAPGVEASPLPTMENPVSLE